jgi:hypothetical protein
MHDLQHLLVTSRIVVPRYLGRYEEEETPAVPPSKTQGHPGAQQRATEHSLHTGRTAPMEC